MTFDNFAFATTIRKFLKNITDLTINVVSLLLIFENVSKNDYVKKFNADRFKRDSDHSRSKSTDFIDYFVCVKNSFYAKTTRR